MFEIVAAYLVGLLTGIGFVGYYAKKKISKLTSDSPISEMAKGMGSMMEELQNLEDNLEDPEDDN